MNENNNRLDKPLYIPVNVLERKDVIEGFGTYEMGIIGIVLTFSIIIFFVLYFITSDVLIPFMIFAFILGLTIMIMRKDQFNENFIDKLRFVKKYIQSQKKYYYKYTNPLFDFKEEDVYEEQ